ncbi:MAG: hypothetical protein QGF53_08745, partial [Alphaproteobacteria bacterium]|nr:hypothetical protein [Alphaproteobacteria bacterium]
EEVEDVLAGSALVSQAAVIGMADERWGERVVAFVEPADENASALALDGHCLDSGLARFKRPRAYQPVDEVCSGRVSLCLILWVSDLIGGLGDVDGAARGSAV